MSRITIDIRLETVRNLTLFHSVGFVTALDSFVVRLQSNNSILCICKLDCRGNVCIGCIDVARITEVTTLVSIRSLC